MVKVIARSNCKCLTFYWKVGGGPSTERHSCLKYIWCNHLEFCSGNPIGIWTTCYERLNQKHHAHINHMKI